MFWQGVLLLFTVDNLRRLFSKGNGGLFWDDKEYMLHKLNMEKIYR